LIVILADTSVLLDIIKDDLNWITWSQGAFETAAAGDDIATNDVIFAELCSRYDAVGDVEAAIGRLGVAIRPIPRTALFQAAKAFSAYRQRGGAKTGVLPDFFIGAHAAVTGARLLTRDPQRVRAYFPGVVLITP
jgi:predicted nucleic acid-binding protein